MLAIGIILIGVILLAGVTTRAFTSRKSSVIPAGLVGCGLVLAGFALQGMQSTPGATVNGRGSPQPQNPVLIIPKTLPIVFQTQPTPAAKP